MKISYRNWSIFFVSLILGFIEQQTFSLLVFDQLYIYLFYFLGMISPLFLGIFTIKINPQNYNKLWYLFVFLIVLSKVIMSITNDLLLYNISGGVILGTSYSFLAFLLIDKKSEQDYTIQSIFFVAGLIISLFLTFTLNQKYNSATELTIFYVILGCFLISSYGIKPLFIDIASSEKKEMDSVEKILNKHKGLYLISLLVILGCMYYVILEIFSNPSMLSAYSKTSYYPYTISQNTMILLLSITFALSFILLILYIDFLENIKTSNPSTLTWKISTRKALIALNVICAPFAMVIVYADDYGNAFVFIFMFFTLIWDILYLMLLISKLLHKFASAIASLTVIAMIKYGVYAVNYFFIQIPWFSALGFGFTFLFLYFFGHILENSENQQRIGGNTNGK